MLPKFQQYFGAQANVMHAVAMAESHLNGGAKNWNCIGTDGKSGACAVDKRSQAYSVDCGIFQINVAGQTCPVELFDTDLNFQAAAGKLQRQGLDAWVAYKNGNYKKYL